MKARLLAGKELAAKIQKEAAARAAAFAKSRGRKPKVGVLMVGANPESQAYLKKKAQACAAAGVECEARTLSGAAAQAECERELAGLSDDPKVDAVLVELPLPSGLSAADLLDRLDPAKDVEGMTAAQMGRLYGARTLEDARRRAWWPCTAEAILLLLESTGVQPEGLEAVVVGRSNVAGKPAAHLLNLMNATVTVCHTGTRDLDAHAARASIVVSATTAPRWLKRVKPGAIVLDAGAHYVDRKVVGDADPSIGEQAGWLTPVPGGIGPVTVALLVRHVVDAAERRAR